MGEEVPVEVDLLVGKGMLEVALELLETNFVATLEASVLFGRLLDGVVGKMHVSRRQIVERKLFLGGA